ncbi:MAG: hypothetical protein ICV74_07695 [Thermoleophilia bacterium]|nr:hypothetical protein [Thermoleophilia bacterium]
MNWDERAARAEERYREAQARRPPSRTGQAELLRMATAAGGAGLAELMRGRRDEGAAWLRRSAECYRASWEGAPAGSWGRPVGALKARLLAGDEAGAAADARWTLSLGAGEESSPIAAYAAALAALVLAQDEQALRLASALQDAAAGSFPSAVADALAALARRDRVGYTEAVAAVLHSFESRDAYLEDVPVADTVLVLQHLAAGRSLAVRLASPLLPR